MIKNAKLLDFENYGYPSIQKIGLFGNNGVFMPMVTLFTWPVWRSIILILKKIVRICKVRRLPTYKLRYNDR
jgi:hypothetical protein